MRQQSVERKFNHPNLNLKFKETLKEPSWIDLEETYRNALEFHSLGMEEPCSSRSCGHRYKQAYKQTWTMPREWHTSKFID